MADTCTPHGGRRLKVTFVVAKYPPSVGGTQLLVQHVAEGLAGLGHSVTVITTDARRSLFARGTDRLTTGDVLLNGVLVKRRPVATRFHAVLRTLRKVFARLGVTRGLTCTDLIASGPLGFGLAVDVWKAARNDDVVVGAGASYLIIPAVDLATCRSSSGAVYLPQLHLSVAGPRPSALRALRRADGIISQTDVERTWLIEHGVEAGRVGLAPPGCKTSDHADLPSSSARELLGIPERLTVGFIGRMAAHKGLDTLVAAIECLWQDHPNLNLLLAGGRTDWSGFDDLLEYTRAIAGDRFIYYGEFDDAEKPLLYAACDIVAFPSREESFGITTTETWSAGRPIVAADIDVTRSIIRPGIDGELVPVGDVASWADVIGDLLIDETRRSRLGSAGRQRVEGEFAWPVIIQEWDKQLQRSVGELAGATATDPS